MFFHFSFSFLSFFFLFSFIFFHFLSIFFQFFFHIFFHFLSFSLHFFQFSFNFSFIFFHFLSFSDIVLSFSLSLLGAQNLIFFVPQFRYDFPYHFGKKNSIVVPVSRGGVPLWAIFSFFSYFFFYRFLSFLLLFFSFFLFFLFITSFLVFFTKKKFLLFFFLVFLSNIFLLAPVSEFNCFLRSRCSMEMWCPDDTGRDGWDWVGPPAWGRACFNSPEWGGGSSPVKTEPPQIVLLLLLSGVNEGHSVYPQMPTSATPATEANSHGLITCVMSPNPG